MRIEERKAVVYSLVEVSTVWGYENFYLCPQCSALVRDTDVHQEWHDGIAASRQGRER